MPIWARYFFTSLLVFFCSGLAFFLEGIYPYPFLLFIPSVISASLAFDRGTGIFAAGLSALLASYFFIEPHYSIAVRDTGEFIAIVVFLIVGVFTAAIIEALRVSVDELSESYEDLQNSQARYKAILDTAVDAIIIIDTGGIIKSFNPAAEKIFGVAANEAIGRNVKMLMPESEARAHDGYIANYMRTGIPKIIGIGREVEGQHKNGTRISLSLSIAEWRDAKGQRFFTGIMRDITKQQEEASQLKSYMQQLEESNRKLDDFVYIVSHDLKEPARAISNYAGFMLEDYADRLDDQGRSQLESLKKMSSRMQELISDLLHYSIIEREDTVLEKVDTREVLNSVLDLMELQISDEKVKIIVANNMPVVFCSRGQFAEIFRNLIMNGLKYNESDVKTIEIGCTTGREEHPGKHVFYVRDNGIGIPEKHKEDIFKMFKRLHGRDDYGGGTGSGLAIVKKMIERNGGKIWVESREGEGSTFYFYLACA